MLLTQRDLQAIHDTLAANHPGPVDPQNDRYRRWLEDGLQVARSQAANARGYADYTRALRRYANGFRDGHIGARFLLASERVSWPGFLVGRDADGTIRVLAAAEDSNVPLRAELLACDGATTEQLIKERLDPYYWNADIPHERWDSLPRLFQFEPTDTAGRMASCSFRIDGATKSIELRWSSTRRETITRHLQSMEPPAPALGLQRRQGIWFVSLPSFNYFGDSAAGINALIGEMTARAAELRSATVVFDVRGNGGGNSAWAERVASAFWGERSVMRVVDSFDWTVDWRVSPDNIAHLNTIVERSERDGLTEAAQSWGQARDALVAAQKKGQSLVRVAETPKSLDRARSRESGDRTSLPADGRRVRECVSRLRRCRAPAAECHAHRTPDFRGCGLHRQQRSDPAQRPGCAFVFAEGLSKPGSREQRVVRACNPLARRRDERRGGHGVGCEADERSQVMQRYFTRYL